MVTTLTVTAMLAAGTLANAAVTPEQANDLKTTLTPLGGEKAGNAAGTIPPWEGGMTTAPSVEMKGDVPVELFPGEDPLYSINANNMAQYTDKLTEGTQALLKKYPGSFRLDVYPTHRTAAAPTWINNNTYENATRCKNIAEGMSVENCFGGIPFPIPQAGSEVIWNFLLRIESEATEFRFSNWVTSSDGSRSLATLNEQNWQHPYYYQEGSPESWSGKYFMQRFATIDPPFKAGESLVIHDSINPDSPRQAWQYLVGQRRVRRAPTVAYDTPDFVASGANYFDEVMGFLGHPDRYDWKIVGKKEMYIPYNANGFITASVEDALVTNHLNPDKLRWELHRVWEVEANVKTGKRHAVPKRRFYFDEDSWLITLMDGYDAEGKLWRTSQIPPFVVPSIPAVVMKPAVIFNLQAKTMSAIQLLNDEEYRVVARKPETFYTGDAVAAESMR
ncbi:MAG: DUF1329 domain-containing protein [Motiliproteus sp.]